MAARAFVLVLSRPCFDNAFIDIEPLAACSPMIDLSTAQFAGHVSFTERAFVNELFRHNRPLLHTKLSATGLAVIDFSCLDCTFYGLLAEGTGVLECLPFTLRLHPVCSFCWHCRPPLRLFPDRHLAAACGVTILAGVAFRCIHAGSGLFALLCNEGHDFRDDFVSLVDCNSLARGSDAASRLCHDTPWQLRRRALVTHLSPILLPATAFPCLERTVTLWFLAFAASPYAPHLGSAHQTKSCSRPRSSPCVHGEAIFRLGRNPSRLSCSRMCGSYEKTCTADVYVRKETRLLLSTRCTSCIAMVCSFPHAALYILRTLLPRPSASIGQQ